MILLLRLALGHHKQMPLKLLGNLLWALGSLMGSRNSRKPCVVFHETETGGEKVFEIHDVYHTLQQEILRRTAPTGPTEHHDTAVAELTESSATAASILLQTLWASTFSQQLPTSVLAGIKSAVLHLADSLDQREGRRTSKVTSEVTSHVAQPTSDKTEDKTEMMSEESKESEESEGAKSSMFPSSLSRLKLSKSPEIVKALQQKLVVLKPTGWQVRFSSVEEAFRCSFNNKQPNQRLTLKTKEKQF